MPGESETCVLSKLYASSKAVCARKVCHTLCRYDVPNSIICGQRRIETKIENERINVEVASREWAASEVGQKVQRIEGVYRGVEYIGGDSM